jgi:hypothetical protein
MRRVSCASCLTFHDAPDKMHTAKELKSKKRRTDRKTGAVGQKGGAAGKQEATRSPYAWTSSLHSLTVHQHCTTHDPHPPRFVQAYKQGQFQAAGAAGCS